VLLQHFWASQTSQKSFQYLAKYWTIFFGISKSIWRLRKKFWYIYCLETPKLLLYSWISIWDWKSRWNLKYTRLYDILTIQNRKRSLFFGENNSRVCKVDKTLKNLSLSTKVSFEWNYYYPKRLSLKLNHCKLYMNQIQWNENAK
jgi:hypothetical protein